MSDLGLPADVPLPPPGPSTLSGGAPLEHNVSARRPGSGVRRVTLDYRNAASGFAPALDVGRRTALDVARSRGADPAIVERLIASVFPAPGVIDPSTRFGIWVGVGPAEVKVYANLTARGGADPTALGCRWPEFAVVAEAALEDGLTSARFACLRLPGDARPEHRIYVGPRPGHGHLAVSRLAERCGLAGGDVLAAISEAQLSSALWRDDVVLAVSRHAGRIRLVVHLSTYGRRHRAAALGAARTASRRLLATDTAVEHLFADLERAYGDRWHPSGVAMAFGADGGVERVNVYAAPMAGVSLPGRPLPPR